MSTSSPHGPADRLDALVAAAAAGRARAVARLISAVENDTAAARALAPRLAATAGRAHVVGLTGPPGVGKSTTTNELITLLRGQNLRVGVLAIDPSSPFSGGALLGDRIRMQSHAEDREVFIRSMSARGHLGGLAAATAEAVRVLDLVGCDVTLVETVGVGQSEVDIAAVADTCVVLLAPGAGDGIQAAKAGVVEIADIFVVNKADHDGAQALVRDLRSTVQPPQPGRWNVPIVTAVATRGDGLGRIWEHVERHRAWAESSGSWSQRRTRRLETEIGGLALGELRARLHRGSLVDLAGLAAAVGRGEVDPFSAADLAVARLTGGGAAG